MIERDFTVAFCHKSGKCAQSELSDPGPRKQVKTNTMADSDTNSLTIEEANLLDPDGFRTYFAQNLLDFKHGSGVEYPISLHHIRDLPSADINACFHLISTTSKPAYEASSWGWHPKRKKLQMQEPDMRYLLVRETTPNRAGGKRMETGIAGFLSFVLTHDSIPAVPVLYVYEIHLMDTARGKGLGQHLMRLASEIAGQASVQKIMLTCFLSNAAALRFYEAQGFAADVSSPEDRKTRYKVIKADYMILSKDILSNDGRHRSFVQSEAMHIAVSEPGLHPETEVGIDDNEATAGALA